MGRGPPYKRTTEERVVADIHDTSRRIARPSQGDDNEERRVVLSGGDKVHYALGLLGVEEDLDDLDLEDDGDDEEGK